MNCDALCLNVGESIKFHGIEEIVSNYLHDFLSIWNISNTSIPFDNVTTRSSEQYYRQIELNLQFYRRFLTHCTPLRLVLSR